MIMVSRLLTGAMAVAVGVSASQMPEFAQQYRQRLGGAVDELKRSVERFDSDAKAQGLSRDEALKRHITNPDVLFQRRGTAMVETISRFDRLDTQLRDLQGALPISRIASLAAWADKDIAGATLNEYEPAIPVTSEGGILAAIGAFLGLLLARLIGWPKRAIARKLAAGRASREARA